VLALLVSLLIALYLLGPDLISRWILAFVVPRKTLVQSRGEEITRAILWAAIPLAAAIAWAIAAGSLRHAGQLSDIQTVFSGLYSDRYFEANQAAFFVSVHNFFWMNLCLLWRLYALVILIAILFNGIIRRYRIWSSSRSRWVRHFLTFIILPRISEWHVLLSEMLLPAGPFVLTADVLTRNNTLYQGLVKDKMLNPDGSLHAVTLANPRRFLRDEFHTAQSANPEIDSADFWKSIPGNLFVILGSDIVNLNLKYIRRKPLSYRPVAEPGDPGDTEVLVRLLERLRHDAS